MWEKPIHGINDFLDCLCFFGICFAVFMVTVVPFLVWVARTVSPVAKGQSRSLLGKLILPLQVIGYPANLFYRVASNLRGETLRRLMKYILGLRT